MSDQIKLELYKDEIEELLLNYLDSSHIVVDGKNVHIEFSAGAEKEAADSFKKLLIAYFSERSQEFKSSFEYNYKNHKGWTFLIKDEDLIAKLAQEVRGIKGVGIIDANEIQKIQALDADKYIKEHIIIASLQDEGRYDEAEERFDNFDGNKIDNSVKEEEGIKKYNVDFLENELKALLKKHVSLNAEFDIKKEPDSLNIKLLEDGYPKKTRIFEKLLRVIYKEKIEKNGGLFGVESNFGSYYSGGMADISCANLRDKDLINELGCSINKFPVGIKGINMVKSLKLSEEVERHIVNVIMKTNRNWKFGDLVKQKAAKEAGSPSVER